MDMEIDLNVYNQVRKRAIERVWVITSKVSNIVVNSVGDDSRARVMRSFSQVESVEGIIRDKFSGSSGRLLI